MYWLVIIFLLIAIMGFMVWASADIGSGIYVKSYCRGKCKEKCVALTFDDSPSPMTEKVLDVLKKHQLKASFFVIGSKVNESPGVVRRIVDEGHIVGNHSWSHTPEFPLKKYKDVIDEIQMTSDAVYNIIGKRPAIFRPPFGVTNPRIGRAITELQMSCIGWSIRSLDTVESRTRENILRRITSQLKPGAIILMHDRCKESDILLEMLLQYLEEKDYKVVTIEEMLNLKIYA